MVKELDRLTIIADSLQDSLNDRDERILTLGKIMEKTKKNDSKYIKRMQRDGQLLRDTVEEKIRGLECEREEINASNERIEAEKLSILQYSSPVYNPVVPEVSKASVRAEHYKDLFLYGRLNDEEVKRQAILLSTEICLTEGVLREKEIEVNQAMGEKRVIEMRGDSTWDLRDHEVRARVWSLRRGIRVEEPASFHALLQERTKPRSYSKDLLIDEQCRGAYLEALRRTIEECEYTRIKLRLLEDVRSVYCPSVVECNRDHGTATCFNTPLPAPEVD